MDFILYVADDGSVSVIDQKDLKNQASHILLDKLDKNAAGENE